MTTKSVDWQWQVKLRKARAHVARRYPGPVTEAERERLVAKAKAIAAQNLVCWGPRAPLGVRARQGMSQQNGHRKPVSLPKVSILEE